MENHIVSVSKLSIKNQTYSIRPNQLRTDQIHKLGGIYLYN